MFEDGSSTKQKKKEFSESRKADKQAEKRALKNGGSSGSDGSDGSGFPARVGGATTAKGRAAELRLARRANGQGDDDGGGDGDDPGSRGPLGADERMPSKPTVRFSCPPNAHPPTRWAEWCIGTSFFSTSLLRAETFSNFDYPPSNRKP
jgi:hypothetical protein